MEKRQDGEWHVFEEVTTKPLERFKSDASRALMQGLAGLATTHQWKGARLEIKALGTEGSVDYDHGRVVCRVRFIPFTATPFFSLYATPLFGNWLRTKVLSDVEAATRDACDTIDTGNRDVFIVHGHNHQATMELKALLGGLGLRPIVLAEQDDRGLTIIEKFEYYGSNCSFAFILMTPDDRTEAVGDLESKWRARQNVIMELGWFISRLGRERVVILYQGKLEIPSDILGVVYIEFKQSVSEASERIQQRLKGVQLLS